MNTLQPAPTPASFGSGASPPTQPSISYEEGAQHVKADSAESPRSSTPCCMACALAHVMTLSIRATTDLLDPVQTVRITYHGTDSTPAARMPLPGQPGRSAPCEPTRLSLVAQHPVGHARPADRAGAEDRHTGCQRTRRVEAELFGSSMRPAAEPRPWRPTADAAQAHPAGPPMARRRVRAGARLPPGCAPPAWRATHRDARVYRTTWCGERLPLWAGRRSRHNRASVGRPERGAPVVLSGPRR
jgi:hypothetical protein